MFLMSSQVKKNPVNACSVPVTRQKSPVFSIVSLPTDSVIVDHAVLGIHDLFGTELSMNDYLVLLLTVLR
jgi:hypothetical protein